MRQWVAPVVRRIGVVMVGMLTAGALSAGVAHAQAPAAKSPFAFSGSSAVFMNFVKADKASQFEGLVQKLKDGLAKSEKAEHKQIAASWKVYKATEAGAGGAVIYVSEINGVATGQDYSMISLLYALYPAESQAIYAQYNEVFATPAVGNLVNLTLVNDLGK